MIFGVPRVVSELSLWGRVPSQRVDLALGLSYIFLCGTVLANSSVIDPSNEKKKWFAYVGSMLWVVVVAYSLLGLPKGAFAGLTSGVVLALLFAIFMSGIWLVLGDIKKFMTISLAISAATTISFNPLSVAPSEVALVNGIKKILRHGSDIDGGADKRVLILGSDTLPMALFSAGVPTINGIFYYPQMGFWRHLGVDEKFSEVFNRYQHLIIIAGRVDASNGYTLDTPQADVVKLTVDAERFNFQLTGAQVVVAQGSNNILARNPNLRLLRSDPADAGWEWFDVIKSN
jgi:hypothetical protein